MKKQLKRAAATTILGLSLTTGFASAQSGTINQTGASSDNRIRHERTSRTTVRNNTDAGVSNSNSQAAYSGDVTSKQNTTQQGSVRSGDAENENETRTRATVNNTSSSSAAAAAAHSSSNEGGAASISNTGFNSNNVVRSTTTNTVDVRNDTNLNVSNESHQVASSGNVNSSQNTTAGSATSGDAYNFNSTTTELSVSN